MTTAQQFPIGTRVRLVSHPAWCGEVIGFDDEVVLVAFRVGEQIATGRHSANALETIEGQAA